MQLLFTTDLTIKALTYIALREDVVTLIELGQVFSEKHTSFKRPFRTLIERRIVSSVKGRNGGFRLEADPAEIYLGELISYLESDMHIVPAIKPDEHGSTRFPDSIYRFTAVQATTAFLDKFNDITLARIAGDPHTRALFGISFRTSRKPYVG